MSWLAAAVEWQSRAVVTRHLRVYMRNWHTAFLPPALEPVTMLLAFGLGLGGYVASLTWQGRPIEYMTYVAPGLLAYATFMTAIFQSLFGAFIRMRYQRTWEGQLTTQVELTHVVWGEVLWAGLLATMYVVIVSAVLAGLPRGAGLLASAICAGCPRSCPSASWPAAGSRALGLCFTALVPTIDHMNLPVFLLVLPMGLLSSTYFPLEHPVLVALNLANPLYHLAQAFRGILIGGPVAGTWPAWRALRAMLAMLVPLDLRLLRRRVLGRLGYGLSTRSGGAGRLHQRGADVVEALDDLPAQLPPADRCASARRRARHLVGGRRGCSRGSARRPRRAPRRRGSGSRCTCGPRRTAAPRRARAPGSRPPGGGAAAGWAGPGPDASPSTSG